MIKKLTYKEELAQFEAVSLEEINSLSLLRRYDSKFLLPEKSLSDFLARLVGHYKVLEIKGQRSFFYDTQYFDSPDLACYLDHQNRRSNRFKIRQRRYAVNDLSFLEVKMKNNKGKTIKNRIPLNGKPLPDKERKEFIESCVSVDSNDLIETASNKFHRITLVSFETKERITIDYDIEFCLDNKVYNSDFYVIVEVKREHMNQQSPVTFVLKSMNIRKRGFSKYCMSLALLRPELKQNTFKKNVLFLKKLKYEQSAS